MNECSLDVVCFEHVNSILVLACSSDCEYRPGPRGGLLSQLGTLQVVSEPRIRKLNGID